MSFEISTFLGVEVTSRAFVLEPNAIQINVNRAAVPCRMSVTQGSGASRDGVFWELRF
jgi:hypothetical protein